MEGNLFSTLVFILWVPVCFIVTSRFRPAIATASLILGGTMLLPELIEFVVPGLPPFEKEGITVLAVAVGLFAKRRGLLRSRRRSRLIRFTLVGMVMSGLATALTNGDPVQMGAVYAQAMVLWDGVHLVVKSLLLQLLPFALGAMVYRSAASVRDLLWVIAVAALLYTLPALVEIRLSPQLHNWTYGFSQHSFLQTRREGGWRPMVFMYHGLALGLFMAAGVTAATALARARLGPMRTKRWLPPLWLEVLLVLCKSKAALIYGTLGGIGAAFVSPRGQGRLAVALGVIVLVYPALRAAEMLPTESIVELAEDMLGAERSQSLDFRFDNEEILVARAVERPLFGWGTYGREMVYDTWEGETDLVRDSYWIIQLGQAGFFGLFLSLFLLVAPIFEMQKALRRRPPERLALLVAGLGWIVAMHAIDLMPNGLFSTMPYLFAGALHGALPDALRPPPTPARGVARARR